MHEPRPTPPMYSFTRAASDVDEVYPGTTTGCQAPDMGINDRSERRTQNAERRSNSGFCRFYSPSGGITVVDNRPDLRTNQQACPRHSPLRACRSDPRRG